MAKSPTFFGVPVEFVDPDNPPRLYFLTPHAIKNKPKPAARKFKKRVRR